MTIFDYMDYRRFLRDYYVEQKRRLKGFSYRSFARIAKFKSSGTLKLVIEGKRNISTMMVYQFAKALKLEARETAFFEALVLYDQAKDPREKHERLGKILSLKPAKKAKGLEGDQLRYYFRKHFVIIREMVALPHFREDAKWIAAQLIPPIEPHEARGAIESLLRLKLLERDANGKLCHSDASVSTSGEIESPEMYEFHREMINSARNALVLFPPDLRDITAITVPLSSAKLEKYKAMLRGFQLELINDINESGGADFDGVFQFNFQFFPVTKIKEQ